MASSEWRADLFATRYSLLAVSRRFHGQIRPVGARDFHAAAGRAVGPADAPDGIVDAHGADAVDDRLVEGEHATDIAVGTAVEERAAGRPFDLAREIPPG